MTPAIFIVRVNNGGTQTMLREVYTALARYICDGLGIDNPQTRSRLAGALLCMAYCGGGEA